MDIKNIFGKKDDNKKKFENAYNNNNGNNFALNAQPDLDTNGDPVKPEEVKKGVDLIVKLDLDKIADLNFISGLIVNYLVGTIFALRNSISDIFNKVSIIIANFLANIIANSFGIVLLVNFINNFIVFISFFIKGNNFANLMITNLINIYNSFVFVFTFIKPFTYMFIIFIGFTVKTNIIANAFSINLLVNLLIFFSIYIVSFGSFIQSDSVVYLMVANLNFDIYYNFISIFTPTKPSTNVFVIFIDSIIKINIVFNLFVNILFSIKPFIELTSTITYKK